MIQRLVGYRTYIALWLPVLAVLGALVTHRAPPEIGWLAFAALVARAVDQTFMRLGVSASSSKPSKQRRLSKKWGLLLPLLLLPNLAACADRGYVSKGTLRPAIRIVVNRHDVYVRKDPELTDAQRERYLRTTMLLRKVVEEDPSE